MTKPGGGGVMEVVIGTHTWNGPHEDRDHGQGSLRTLEQTVAAQANDVDQWQ